MDRAAGDLESVVIETLGGKLAGQRAGNIFVFKGIPYAAPPVGPLRWRPPQPAKPWPGIREATHFGPIAPQAPTQIEMLLGGSMGTQSEDCLYLNVWTPGCDDAKRPVMVWIHGGAFVIGSASQGLYNGRHLAAHDVVIVTINYRLGALGFLNLIDVTEGQIAATGSEGIADQILALEWVRKNIESFGGDPENVTIFGESAGAMSVAALMAIPAARGLFHKAIVQSGSAHIGYDRERSAKVAHALLSQLGLAATDTGKLRELPHQAIIDAQIALFADKDERGLGDVPFQPTIDQTLIPMRPIEAIRAGSAGGIPLIAGTTKEEWKLFSGANPRIRLMSRSTLAQRIERLAKDAAPQMLAAYADGTTFDRFNALMTDRVFAVPTARLLEAQSAYAPAFGYRFDWCSRLLGGLMGSCHALDLGHVFGTFNTKMAGAFFGSGPAAEALSDAMMGAWTEFARSGSPAIAATSTWQSYDSDHRRVMIFGDGTPHVVERPYEARRVIWDSLPEYRLGPT